MFFPASDSILGELVGCRHIYKAEIINVVANINASTGSTQSSVMTAKSRHLSSGPGQDLRQAPAPKEQPLVLLIQDQNNTDYMGRFQQLMTPLLMQEMLMAHCHAQVHVSCIQRLTTPIYPRPK